MRVIGVVGLAGSGKGEVGAVACESGIPVVTMGDVIREACRERGLDPAEHHGKVASALREEDGPLAIAERTLPRIQAASEKSESDTVVVDGLRSDAELDRFRDEFGEAFELVAIEAPFETRAERIDVRGRDDTARETLAQRDERERGFGMGAAIERADTTIENAGSLEGFHDRIRALLAEDGRDESGNEYDEGVVESVIYRVDVSITAPVNPTEVTDRVVDAVVNLFPEATVEREPGEVRAETHSLEGFSERLHEQEILDAARGRFFNGREDDTFAFELKKQAAFEGAVNFAVGEPDELGTVGVTVTVHEPEVAAYIDHFAPPTEDGLPVDSGA